MLLNFYLVISTWCLYMGPIHGCHQREENITELIVLDGLCTPLISPQTFTITKKTYFSGLAQCFISNLLMRSRLFVIFSQNNV